MKHMAGLCVALLLACLDPSHAADEPRPDYGIRVGEAKVYDDRALGIMLEELHSQLRRINVITSEPLVTALGELQGSTAQTASTKLQLGSPITPGVETTETAAATSKGPDIERVTTTAENTPAPPTLPTVTSKLPTFTPTLGLGADDLLANQVNLTYQIYNMRMALERAVSDRLDGARNRTQAVLTIPVSIDPPQGMHDRAAYVEVNVTGVANHDTTNALCEKGKLKTASEANPVRLSLVSMMPLEKTYNTSALSSRTNAFGGSAVMSVLTLGLSHESTKEQLYLYRDIDTMALQFPQQGDAASLSFGWAFKPVLGRRSVAPGTRQMLAVVSLTDLCEDVAAGGNAAANGSIKLNVSVNTYWRKYDRKRLTMGRQREGITALAHAGAPAVLKPGQIAEKLKPKVSKLEWVQTGPDSFVASIHGENFYPGTRIMIGERVLAEDNTGLLIKSETLMELRGSIAALMAGDVFISGRYGGTADFSGGIAEKFAAGSGGIMISGTHFNTYDLQNKGMTWLHVRIADRQFKALNALPGDLPLLIGVGAHVAATPYQVNNVTCSDYRRNAAGRWEEVKFPCLEISVLVPSAWLEGDVPISARFMFAAPIWSDMKYSTGSNPYELLVLGGSKVVRLALRGEFDQTRVTDLSVRLDRIYSGKDFKLKGNLLLFDVPAAALADFRQAVVDGPRGTELVAVPTLKRPDAEPPIPRIYDAKAPQIAVAYTGIASLQGANLKQIETLEFKGTALKFRVDDDSRITFVVPTALVDAVGERALVLKAKDGAWLTAKVIVR